MPRILVLMLAFLMIPLSAAAAADAKHNLAQLEKLESEIRGVLPAGWTLDFHLAEMHFGGMRPLLTIESKDELPVERFYPGMPAFEAERPAIAHERVTLRLALVPYVSPQEHAVARERNDAAAQQRRQFVATHLQGVPFAHKGNAPPAAFAFSPRSTEEARLIREYAFLCLATEPEQLPTHHYGTLSMWYAPEMLKIHHEGRSQEYDQIVASLEKILHPFEERSDRHPAAQ